KANEALAGYTGGVMSLRLYQLGLAQLGLARESNDLKLYKDAGLSFMRVVAYFHLRSRYEGGALVGAAEVHIAIDELKHARDLLNRAGNLVTEEEDPDLYKHLLKLQEQAAQTSE
ncbi:MAG: hypothetical protein R3336_04025, partial [Phycisphaeraceae bacterium]|nr:hypothetical protein [Phycisphaeraceae bacterium]